jgi:FlaA1/EpsC-like NDP-sugar epimerase
MRMDVWRKTRWGLLDAGLAFGSLALAYALLAITYVAGVRSLSANIDTWSIIREYVVQVALVAGPIVALRLLLFVLFGIYRGISRFAGLHELRQVILAVSAGSVSLLVWDQVAGFSPNWLNDLRPGVPAWIPTSVIVVDWLACIVLVGGARLAQRMWALTRFNSTAAIHNVLIIGAGDVGEVVVHSLLHNPQTGYRPVGFVDSDESLVGRQIHGLGVLGTVDDLPRLIEELHVAEVIVAIRQPGLRFLNRVVEMCENEHVGFKIVPAVSDVIQERVSISQMRPVEIEDLLGREPVDLTLAEDVNYLEGEVVLVTGGGGSIGSELCRQILRCHPLQLILLGRGENSLHEIGLELGFRLDDPKIVLEVADIRDVDRLEGVFERYKPTVVFHAAAHKHVTFMELYPQEAVKNNIVGTFNVGFLARQAGVRRFILISTDKAVHPTSVMGASKRVAETIVTALSRDSRTDFVTVRFGNVLGSRGSVVPIFRRQIAMGGPVTVAHPDMERYFMTIPEAANLVLQAGAMGRNGQLFILDMGRPVRILDLARHMITLSGYEPNVDIEIEFTGIRPGEKLQEELLTEGEDIEPTAHPRIFATRVNRPTLDEVKGWLRRLDGLAADDDGPAIVEALRSIVPEYEPALGVPPAAGAPAANQP